MKHYEIQLTCQYQDPFLRHRLKFEYFTERVFARHSKAAITKAEKIAIKKMEESGKVNPKIFFFDSIKELSF